MKDGLNYDRIVVTRVRIIDGMEVSTIIEAFVINDSGDETAAETWAAGQVAAMRDRLDYAAKEKP